MLGVTQLARWRIACMIGSCAVAVLALFELNRIERGRLFLLALPGERAASEVEKFDARQTAVACRYPTVGVVLAVGVVIAWLGPMARAPTQFPYSVPMLAVFGIAMVADMVTTIRFFHSHSVADELHPGIRLFGYAYGRTVGAVLAKLVQFVGVLAIAFLLGQRGQWIIAIATFLYFAAAVYNAFFAH